MSKNIIRVMKNKDNPYLMLNTTSLKDSSISWKAKGLHAYLLSLPDDWKIYINELKDHATDGRESTTSAIKELINSRYIVRNQLKNENGRFEGYEYLIYEIPLEQDDSPENVKPVNGYGDNGEPDTTNYLSKLNIDSNNQSVSQPEPTDELTDIIKPYTPELRVFFLKVILSLPEQYKCLITMSIIDYALYKYRTMLEQKPIKNHDEYFRKCLISSIEEEGLRNFE
jgi:hypothetical protein